MVGENTFYNISILQQIIDKSKSIVFLVEPEFLQNLEFLTLEALMVFIIWSGNIRLKK